LVIDVTLKLMINFGYILYDSTDRGKVRF